MMMWWFCSLALIGFWETPSDDHVHTSTSVIVRFCARRRTMTSSSFQASSKQSVLCEDEAVAPLVAAGLVGKGLYYY